MLSERQQLQILTSVQWRDQHLQSACLTHPEQFDHQNSRLQGLDGMSKSRNSSRETGMFQDCRNTIKHKHVM